MSRAVVVGLRPHYLIVPKLNTQHMTVTSRDVTTQLRIQRRGPRGRFPYFQTKQKTEGRKKIFFSPESTPVVLQQSPLPRY